MATITYENVYRTYSGRVGCMCGCLGEYRDTDLARKRMLSKLVKHEDVKLQLWDNDSDDVMGCIFVMTEHRNNVAYLRKGTDIPAELMEKLID